MLVGQSDGRMIRGEIHYLQAGAGTKGLWSCFLNILNKFRITRFVI